MRSAINTCLMILFLLVVLFSSFSRAADCPIGDTPVLKFPLGTSQIYSTCTNGCRAEDNFSSTSTWTCSETVGYCTAAFFTTGESCTGSDDTDGSCDVNGDCSPNDNGSGGDGGDSSNNPVTQPSHVETVCENAGSIGNDLKIKCDGLKDVAKYAKYLHEQSNQKLNADIDGKLFYTEDRINKYTNDRVLTQSTTFASWLNDTETSIIDALDSGFSNLGSLLEKQDALSESNTSLIRSEI